MMRWCISLLWKKGQLVRQRNALVAVIVVTLGISIAASQQTKGPPAGTLVIDGRKGIHQFPEWFIWEQTFVSLDADQSRSRIPLNIQLGVSASDLTVLMAELKRFHEAQAILLNALRNAKVRALGSRGLLEPAVREAQLAYRYQLLEIKSRVITALSRKGAEGLRAWIENRLSKTKLHLRGQSIAYFGLPR
jgi:hypothetical protein